MIDTCDGSKVWFCEDVRLTWKPNWGIRCYNHGHFASCTTWMLLTRDAEQALLNISGGFYFKVYQKLSNNLTLSV